MDRVKGCVSGYDFVCRVLREKPENPIGYLLSCAHDNECDFLEFKAGMELKPENAKPGETQDDLYWDYAQAVIALINTKGGAFVVGVKDDSHEAVGLETNDPRHVIGKRGLEAYVREEVDAHLNPPDLAWKSKGGVNWRLRATLAPYLDSRIVTYDQKAVILVLVKPCVGSCIRVVREKQAERSEKMPIRRLGNIGRVQLLDFQNEWEEWESHRSQPSELIEQLADRLEHEGEEAACEQAIRAYYARLEEKAKCRMAEFTSLDARERPFADEAVTAFFSPEAIELGEDDETWLKDDEEDESLAAASKNGLEELESEGDDDCDDVEWGESTDATLRQGDLLGFLRDEKRIIVSGEPGGGKTTCLQHFALQFGRCANDVKPVLALFIPMGQWERACSLEQMMSKVSRLSPGQLSQLVAENRLRLVIDAVNECPDSLRPAAIRNICLYLQDRPGLRAVISTRHPEELKELGLPVFRVQPMDKAHRRRYLERYLNDSELADKLMSQIVEMPGGETIAENPMLLRLVVEVYGRSPSRRLPSGRAGLYRRSLRGWYTRERERRSGERLRWDVKQAIGLLSELAYRSRLNGYRDIPLGFVRELWGADAEARVQELCQCPVLYLDEEFVRFRHETFQEYLCAEFMVSSQEPLPEWSAADYSRWGMPMAYAYELLADRRKCPEKLWLKAWELNPWMGVAITERSVGESIMRRTYRGAWPSINGMHPASRDEFVRAGSVYAAAMAAHFSPKVLMDGVASRLSQSWYRKTDSALSYLVSVTEECRSRWMDMESAQLGHLKDLRVGAALALARSWLFLENPRGIFQYHASDSWERWVSTPDPKLAKELVDAGVALPEDFENAKRVWVEDVSLKKALLLGRRGMLNAADVVGRVPEWIATASVLQAVEMIRLGWCQRSDFMPRAANLLLDSDARMLITLVKEGLFSSVDVHDRAVELMRDADLGSIEELVGVGILELSECHERLQAIKAMGRAEDAVALIRLGVADVGEFPGMRSWWIEHATPESLSLLVENGLASQGDIEARIGQLIATATPLVACKMIGNRLVGVSAFYGRAKVWAEQEQYESVAEFVEKYGDEEVRRRLAPSVGRWIADANASSAVGLVRGGFAKCEDFADRLPWWKEIGNQDAWRNFQICGFVSLREYQDHEELRQSIAAACKAVGEDPSIKADFTGQVAVWMQVAPLSCVGHLIRSGLAAAEDFRKRRADWIAMAKGDVANCIVRMYRNQVITLSEAGELALPLVDSCTVRDAECLCGEKILLNGEFFARKNSWIASVDVDDAVRLVNLGIVYPEDLESRKSGWVSESTPKVACWLVRAGIVPPGDFHDRIAVWKNEWTMLDAARLINDGIVALEDVKDDARVEEYCRKKTVRGVVRMVTTDGAEVSVDGVTALLPMAEFKSLQGENALRIGKEYEFELVDSATADFVLSRWGVLKRQALQRIKEKGIYEGVVKSIGPQGAEVALDCLRGFLHLDDMSWERLENPNKLIRVGQRLRVMVLDKYVKRCRLSLGLKQMVPEPPLPPPSPLPRPPSPPLLCPPRSPRPSKRLLIPKEWDDVEKRFPVGTKVRGKVVHLAKFGAFVELEEGLDGLLHVSEMGRMPGSGRPADCLDVGQEIDVIVKSLDMTKHRISLCQEQAR